MKILIYTAWVLIIAMITSCNQAYRKCIEKVDIKSPIELLGGTWKLGTSELGASRVNYDIYYHGSTDSFNELLRKKKLRVILCADLRDLDSNYYINHEVYMHETNKQHYYSVADYTMVFTGTPRDFKNKAEKLLMERAAIKVLSKDSTTNLEFRACRN